MERDIKKIETRMFQVPLDEVLADAKHGDHYFFELVTVTITLADGSQGTGSNCYFGRAG